jgi:tellurite resistance protein TerC
LGPSVNCCALPAMVYAHGMLVHLSPTLAACPFLWLTLGFTVPVALAADLGVMARLRGVPVALPSTRSALLRTLAYAALAIGFAAGLAYFGGPQGPGAATDFATIFVVEFALSVDNLFVFLLLFESFKVPPKQAQRVLVYGILGALMLRGALIYAGAALLGRFAWLFYVLGAMLVVTGVKLLWPKAHAEHGPPAQGVVGLLRKILPLASEQSLQYASPGAWTLRENGRRVVTPLLLVLLAVEASDVVFALDSVPASFAITQDVAIIYSANVCAILGLRALYFAMAHALRSWRYLTPGLAVVLILIGCKMVCKEWYEIGNGTFLAVVALVLGSAAGASIWTAPPVKK